MGAAAAMSQAVDSSESREVERSFGHALTLGILAMESGSSTATAEDVFQHVLAGAGITDGFAIWRIDSATAGRSRHGGALLVRPIGAIGENFRRLAEIELLAGRARTGAVGPSALGSEIERVRTLASPYNRWMTLAATACTGGLFVRTTTGHWTGFLIAFMAAAVGQLVRWRLQRRGAPGYVMTIVGATVSALVASAGLRLWLGAVPPGALVASIIYLIPGVPLMNGFIDVGTQKYLIVGTQRITTAAFLSTLLALGVGFAAVLASLVE